MPLTIKFGSCFLADMNPGRKSKPGKTRPVLVIQSSDLIEAGTPGIVIVPLTSQLKEPNILRRRITKGDLPSLEKDSDILVDQIHTIDRTLFYRDLGPVSKKIMEGVMEGVHFVLGKAKYV